MESKGKLTGEQFWKWKAHITDIEVAEKNLEIEKQDLKIFERDSQLIAFKSMFKKQRADQKANKLQDAKDEYAKVKLEIEQSLGFGLEDATIDPLTYDVTLIPKA